MARRISTPEPVLHGFAIIGDVSSAPVSLSGGDLVCPGHGQTLAEESLAQAHRAQHNPPRRRNLLLRLTVSLSGIPDLLGLGPEERPAARRHSEHYRPLDDADGDTLLAGTVTLDSKRKHVGTAAQACPEWSRRGCPAGR